MASVDASVYLKLEDLFSAHLYSSAIKIPTT